MSRTRMTPDARKAQIMDAALDVAARTNYRFMTREEVAETAGCSPGLITAYHGRIDSLRDDVMREAVKRGRLPIIAQGLAARDPIAQAAPVDLQREALRGLAP